MSLHQAICTLFLNCLRSHWFIYRVKTPVAHVIRKCHRQLLRCYDVTPSHFTYLQGRFFPRQTRPKRSCPGYLGAIVCMCARVRLWGNLRGGGTADGGKFKKCGLLKVTGSEQDNRRSSGAWRNKFAN